MFKQAYPNVEEEKEAQVEAASSGETENVQNAVVSEVGDVGTSEQVALEVPDMDVGTEKLGKKSS